MAVRYKTKQDTEYLKGREYLVGEGHTWAVMGQGAFMAHGPEEKKRRRMPNRGTVVFVAPFFSLRA